MQPSRVKGYDCMLCKFTKAVFNTTVFLSKPIPNLGRAQGRSEATIYGLIESSRKNTSHGLHLANDPANYFLPCTCSNQELNG